MPIYEYECTAHGTFELLRNVALARQHARCPQCQVRCHRILSPPHLSTLSKGLRTAHERHERSRHEPRLEQRRPKVHRCGSACAAPLDARPTPHRRRAQVYTGARPWVLEHG